jgi:O-antigen ligase
MIKFISNILVLIVVFQTFNDNLFVEYLGPNSLKISILVFALFFIKYIFFFKSSSPINLKILLLCVIMTLSSAVNYNQLFFPLESFTTPFIILVYFCFFSQYKDVKWLIFSILFSLVFSSIYCLIREDFISEWGFRKTGGTGDPNEFSVGILFGFGLVWGLYLKYKKYFLVVILLNLFFLTSLLAAGSKSAFFTLIIFIFILIFYIMEKSSFLRKIKLVFSISLVSSILCYTFYYLNEEVFSLFLQRFESSSTADLRFDNWSRGFNLFKDNWFFGVGTNNYGSIMNYTFTDMAEGSTAAHNMYLQAIYELGVLGFFVFIFILKDLIKNIIFNKRNYITLLICASFLIMGFSLSLSYEKYVWLIIALSFNNHFINFFLKKSFKYENNTIYSKP